MFDPTKTDFYQAHLDQVSRSFAFCIAQLRPPLREWVGLSYLLCRVVDTIEDASWGSTEEQLRAFRRFDASLRSCDDIAQVRDLDRRVPSGISRDERHLLADAARLMADFHALPTPVRQTLESLIHSMSLGMQHFARQKPLVLRTLREVNQYCFFVAGVVGEMLARLLAEVDQRFVITGEMLLNAHHFGQFLQKVNVLKDQVDDEAKGRNLVPSRDEVERSVGANARHALAFLLSVPREQVEFRRFCAWSLFMGLESLVVARQSAAARAVLSIPRERNVELLEQVELALADDAGLTLLFNQAAARLDVDASLVEVSADAGAVPVWFGALYQGPLKPAALRALGL